MKTTTRICALCRGLMLLLITAVVIAGCGGQATSAPAPTSAPPATAEPTSAPAAAPATAAPIALAVPGTAIAISTGGSLIVPEGALPVDAKVSAMATQVPPLPDDVKPVGDAFSLTASAQPSQPVILRLPIPAGAADPASLVVIRVESDGAATFLMTEVDGSELVAATPGFSTFAIGELLPDQQVRLAGDADMIPGEREVFCPRFETNLIVRDAQWRVSGNFTLVFESATSAIVQAGGEPGYGMLNYEFVDLTHGRRWVGSRVLSSYSGAGKFKVSLITRTPLAYAGEDVLFTASAYGEYEGPITWNWDFGNGTTGEKTTDAAVRNLELPLTRYEAMQEQPLRRATLTARDAKNREAKAGISVLVRERAFEVVLEGPQVLTWQAGGVSAAYAAAVSGGQGQAQYTWRLLAGVPSIVPYGEAAEQSFTFPEPGDYRLEVAAADEATAETRAFLPIRIRGGEGLGARILDLPATARPGDTVAFNVQVRGGVLVVAGKKDGYTVVANWSDGGQPSREKGAGADRTPDQGAVVSLSHAWTEPKTYKVIVMAWDAAGRMSVAVRDITITDAAPATLPSAPKANTPPAAEDIATSTKAGAAVAITLKGSDADGDKLTYTFARPANGAVTGTAPFLTYTPKAGFSGTDTFTYKVRDGQAESRTATVTITVEGLQWVRVGAPLINASDPKAPLEYYGGGQTPGYFEEERFTGKYEIYRLSETLIAKDDREVDRGKEFWNVTYESRFDAPPKVLAPGQVLTLTVKMSTSGSVAEGTPPGVTFQFGADKAHGNIIQPSQPLGYNPWLKEYSGVDSGSWTLTVPNGRPGDTFQVWAGWWNCAMCNVTWTYRYGGE